MKNWLQLIFWISVIALVWLVSVWLFTTIADPNNSIAFENAYGALFGALFGVLLGQIFGFVTRLAQTERRHFGSLVLIDYNCNLMHNQLSDAIFLIDGFLSSSGKLSECTIPIWGSRFPNIEHLFDQRPNIKYLDLLNEILGFSVKVKKFNSDCDMLNRNLNDIQTLFKEEKIDASMYAANIGILTKDVRTLRVYLTSMQNDLKRLHAVTRLRLKTKPFYDFVYRLIHQDHRKRLPLDIVDNEILNLEREMKRTSLKESSP